MSKEIVYQLKNLKQEILEISLPENETVEKLVEMIKTKDPNSVDKDVIVIFTGKKLDYDTKLETLGYKEGNHLVYISKKKQTQPQPSQPQPTTQSQPQTQQNEPDTTAAVSLSEKMMQATIFDQLMRQIAIPEVRKNLVENTPSGSLIKAADPALFDKIINDENMLQKGQEAYQELITHIMNSSGMPNTDSIFQESRPQDTGINLSTEDAEAVNELVMITGKSKSEVVQIYMACDKNKEATINMLLME